MRPASSVMMWTIYNIRQRPQSSLAETITYVDLIWAHTTILSTCVNVMRTAASVDEREMNTQCINLRRKRR